MDCETLFDDAASYSFLLSNYKNYTNYITVQVLFFPMDSFDIIKAFFVGFKYCRR